ncbi:hypothetical protein P9F86_13885 [Bacillus altitudinis]|uniref:hypothetical protein n=1 Tax=Bacillus TaxID=1386 RepID=UPI0005979040|nr:MULTISPECIES: hypothetical protein [Bacillus]MBX7002511.1 hypothetical protein [Bacillus aerophilus]KAJ0072559.1 hypothetical protein DBB48_010735 [Bacillus altitudinis]KIL26785.1 hypothetical protein B4133_1275 [Bacillus altitudinis]KJF46994.1 membrane protein [Bacillus altitudinis]MBR0578990.1 hypothetical protein [Bacillus altitudinis A23-8]
MRSTTIGLVAIGLCFCLNILGLMKMLPLYLTSPLLFASILFTLYRMNHRKTFKGFKT